MLCLGLILFAFIASASILTLNDSNFDSFIGGARPVFVKFSTTCTRYIAYCCRVWVLQTDCTNLPAGSQRSTGKPPTGHLCRG